MAFERICFRRLPDGSFRKVYPFHVSLEGMAELALCRDDEDYDVMVKYLFVCARRKNVLVVIYIAMSNHGHATILATGQEEADAFKVEWLRMYSQYFSHKYRQKKVLRHTSAVALYLDSDWYVRNTLAYVPKTRWTHSPGWRITAGRATGACSVEERYPAVSGQPVR